jgi:hypothetical protein
MIWFLDRQTEIRDDDCLAPSRQDAKFSKVFGFLLRAFASLREILRFFWLQRSRAVSQW